MKNKSALILAVLSLMTLTACGGGSDSGGDDPETKVTSYQDITKDSIYGKLTDFDIKPDEVKVGDTLTFKATPSKYFFVDEVTNNGDKCKVVKENEDGSVVFETTIKEGLNRIKGSYYVDRKIDFVDEFKIPISDEVFNEVMSRKKMSEGEGNKKEIDFRKSGIEQVGAPLKWEKDKYDENNKKVSTGYFVNYVDGDTTHVETYNLGYTVKIRYLSIDTPESTSEIEEWGLTASNYSKYIYSGNEEYKKAIEATTDFTGVQAGVTSLILMSQDASINSEKIKKEDLKIGTTEDGPYKATTDGNQRNLAYVWYSTSQPDTEGNVPKNSFRCLNLEMVYQGFSFGVGSREDTSDYYYRMFDAAHLSAQANRRHLFSGLDDNNYYYYEERGVQDLTLTQLYSKSKTDSDIGYYPESVFCDKKTLYRVTGYVSRKLATAFFIQEKPSYTNEEVDQNKCFGIYVFTYTETPIAVGDKVSVIGAISSYGGTYQMQGISYHDLKIDPNRDTIILSSGHEIVPIELTGEQFNNKKLPQVLVKLTDNIWFYDFSSEYQSVKEPIGEGGSEEINKYNASYPFYNTSNAPIVYASFGEKDNAEYINETSKNIRYDTKIIRFTVDQDILVRCGVETCYSYKFFVGGSYLYNPKGAEYANLDDTNPFKGETVERTFKRKASLANNGKGLIVMSTGYESTSGKKKMTAKICSGLDVKLTNLEEVD